MTCPGSSSIPRKASWGVVLVIIVRRELMYSFGWLLPHQKGFGSRYVAHGTSVDRLDGDHRHQERRSSAKDQAQSIGLGAGSVGRRCVLDGLPRRGGALG